MGEDMKPTNTPPRAMIVGPPQAAFDIYDAVAPFIEAWKALPLAIQASRARNLADVIGIYRPDDRAALTVGNLTDLVQAFVEIGLLNIPKPSNDAPRS